VSLQWLPAYQIAHLDDETIACIEATTIEWIVVILNTLTENSLPKSVPLSNDIVMIDEFPRTLTTPWQSLELPKS
jgi:hypothetical protein